MGRRILVGLIATVIFLAIIMQPNYWWGLAFIGIVHIVALVEFSSLLPGMNKTWLIAHIAIGTLVYLFASTYLVDSLYLMPWQVPGPPVLILLVLALAVYAIGAVAYYERGETLAQFDLLTRSLMLVTLPFSFLPALVCRFDGFPYLILLVGVSWAADTGAIFTGKALGRTPLCPRTSPKKTLEGVIGGVLAAGATWAVAELVFGGQTGAFPQLRAMLPDWAVLAVMFLVGSGVSLLGVFGDLLLSVLKRIAGIKDYGAVMPGHGGFLDRVDSMLFTAPVLYLLCYLSLHGV